MLTLTCRGDSFVTGETSPVAKMAMAQAPWPRSVDLTHTFQPPLTLTMDCAHPEFTDGGQRTSLLCTEGSDMFESRDAFPVTEKPVPTSTHLPKETLWGADPSLCVTPEKPLTGSRLLTSGKSVRFNPLVEVQRRSDENSLGGNTRCHIDVHKAATASGSSLGGYDVTAETSPEVGAMPLDESLGPISILASDFERDIANSGSVLSKSANSKSNEEILPRAHDPMSADTGSRSDSLRSHGTKSAMLGVEFEESDALLAKPGLNSSRWVTTELRQLQVNDLNVDLALRRKLASSVRLRNDITEKACSRVNAEGGRQFVNLLSVDVCEGELVKTMEEMTTARVKPLQPARGLRAEEFGGHEPDILDMLREVEQQETPSVALDALPTLHGQLRTVDIACAFDVIKHVRAWESW